MKRRSFIAAAVSGLMAVFLPKPEKSKITGEVTSVTIADKEIMCLDGAQLTGVEYHQETHALTADDVDRLLREAGTWDHEPVYIMHPKHAKFLSDIDVKI